MSLIFGATCCCIGILLIGFRGVMRQRRLRKLEERLNRTIQEVVSNCDGAPRRLKPKTKTFVASPFFPTEESLEAISQRNKLVEP